MENKQDKEYVMSRLLKILLGLCLVAQAHAFPCYITMVKSNCWANYNVNVDVVDVLTDKVIASMSMPVGTTWDRKEIVCQPQQSVQLKATFSPVIWEKDEGKIYFGKRTWSFPAEIKKGSTAWNMGICFSGDFAETSIPPDALGPCQCDMKSIPPVEPR